MGGIGNGTYLGIAGIGCGFYRPTFAGAGLDWICAAGFVDLITVGGFLYT